MGRDYDVLFPGRFLKSGEFAGKDATMTIARVRTEDLPDKPQTTRVRGIIGFKETKKELVLNRTNGECLKAMFGRDVDAWVGKRVTFFPAPHFNNITKEMGTAIRVRGSPDLTADMPVEIRLAQHKPFSVLLKRVVRGGARPAAAAAPPPQPPPPPLEPPAEEEPQLGLPPDDMLLPGEEGFGS